MPLGAWTGEGTSTGKCDDCMDAGDRVTQDAVTEVEFCREQQPRTMHDYMDVGVSVTQDAVTDEQLSMDARSDLQSPKTIASLLGWTPSWEVYTLKHPWASRYKNPMGAWIYTLKVTCTLGVSRFMSFRYAGSDEHQHLGEKSYGSMTCIIVVRNAISS